MRRTDTCRAPQTDADRSTRFFPSTRPFLESLCDYLYDYLRPRILHEQSITTLCQVCTVVQALMVLDTIDSDGEDDDETGSEGGLRSRGLSPVVPPEDKGSPASEVSPFSKPRARFATEADQLPAGTKREDRMLRLEGLDRSARKAHMASLLKPVLQDAQTRLVFRGQALIVNEVGRFMPTEKDLNYPGVIIRGASRG